MTGGGSLHRLPGVVRRAVAAACVGAWRPYSHLLVTSDTPHWVLSWEMRELTRIARQLGVRQAPFWCHDTLRRQTVFFASHFDLLNRPAWFQTTNRLATAYFHGRPGTGYREFDDSYEQLRQWHSAVARIQVSHAEMRDVVLATGIDAAKVFLIPIGVNLAFFKPQTSANRRLARERLGLPLSAVVIGSFQKDGVGWEDGTEPKLIKGPDVFLEAVRILKSAIPELWVLLSGPARGYVKAGLARLGVPCVHRRVKHYPDIGGLYQALDAYMVGSRQEGGPKAVLEAMASGVPLVTTRVGQAMDIVRTGENGWMVPVEDAAGLAHWTLQAVSSRPFAVVDAGLRTAATHAYTAQLPLWRSFLKGFVDGVG